MPKREREFESNDISHDEHDDMSSSSGDSDDDGETLIDLETETKTVDVEHRNKTKDNSSKKKSTDDDDEEDEELVDVDFDFVDPKEIHFHSIKRLLKNYLPNHESFDISGVTNVIIEQCCVGTMIQINDDVDAYGFITLLPLDAYTESQPCVKELVDSFLEKQYINSDEDRLYLKTLFETEGTALLLHDRMINLPPQIAPPLHDSLKLDIEWTFSNKDSMENEDNKEVAPYFKNLKKIVLIAPCDIVGSDSAGAATGNTNKNASKKNKKRKVEQSSSVAEIYYHRFDDEVYSSLAEKVITCKFPLKEKDIAKGGKQQNRVLMVLPSDCLTKGIDMIKTLLGNTMMES